MLKEGTRAASLICCLLVSVESTLHASVVWNQDHCFWKFTTLSPSSVRMQDQAGPRIKAYKAGIKRREQGSESNLVQNSQIKKKKRLNKKPKENSLGIHSLLQGAFNALRHAFQHGHKGVLWSPPLIMDRCRQFTTQNSFSAYLPQSTWPPLLLSQGYCPCVQCVLMKYIL